MSGPARRLRTVSAAAAALALASATPAAAARPNPAQFLSSQSATHVVHLTLLAALGSSNNSFNFDGYGRGELLVQIPLGWRVVVDCENRGGLRHSCAIVKGSLATTPAFPGASTRQPTVGLSPGAEGDLLVRRATHRQLPHRLPRPGPRAGAHVGRARRRARRAPVDHRAAGP